MATGPRDFPLMEKYYEEPGKGWSLDWTRSTLLAAGAILAIFLLAAWLMGRL